jgi:pilus assembly protein CpaC
MNTSIKNLLRLTVRVLNLVWVCVGLTLAGGGAGAAAADNGQKSLISNPLVPVVIKTLAKDVPELEVELISIFLNKAHYVQLSEPVRDIVIANPDIANVLVKTPTDLYLMGQSLGTTNAFLLGEKGQIIRHIVIEVKSDINAARKAIEALLPGANVDVKSIGDSLVLTGTVRSSAESVDAVDVARRFVKEDSKVINLLRVLKDLQVLLQVRVAEMQRTTIKNLAASSSFDKLIRNSGLTVATTAIIPRAVTSAISGTISFNKLGLQSSTITALERQGLVKTLAEPALTAISGETANFLAGGEIPTPAGVDTQGNLLVEFREFGVALSFTPVVLDQNQINLRISTEVSRIAEENRLTLPFGTNNQTVEVLGLAVRRAQSTVNLTSGDSMMIAGMLQRDEVNQTDGTPWLKDIPVLGALFRSQAYQNNETELVVLVTPYIVRPVKPTNKLNLPTDGFVPASDIDMYLLGRLYKQYGQAKSDRQKIPLLQGPIGYVMK